MKAFHLITLALAFALAGCGPATIPFVTPKPDLILAVAQVRSTRMNIQVTFPAGRYVALTQTAEGVFYKSQGIILAGLSGKTPMMAESGIVVKADGHHGLFLGNLHAMPLDRDLDLAP